MRCCGLCMHYLHSVWMNSCVGHIQLLKVFYFTICKVLILVHNVFNTLCHLLRLNISQVFSLSPTFMSSNAKRREQRLATSQLYLLIFNYVNDVIMSLIASGISIFCYKNMLIDQRNPCILLWNSAMSFSTLNFQVWCDNSAEMLTFMSKNFDLRIYHLGKDSGCKTGLYAWCNQNIFANQWGSHQSAQTSTSSSSWRVHMSNSSKSATKVSNYLNLQNKQMD